MSAVPRTSQDDDEEPTVPRESAAERDDVIHVRNVNHPSVTLCGQRVENVLNAAQFREEWPDQMSGCGTCLGRAREVQPGRTR